MSAEWIKSHSGELVLIDLPRVVYAARPIIGAEVLSPSRIAKTVRSPKPPKPTATHRTVSTLRRSQDFMKTERTLRRPRHSQASSSSTAISFQIEGKKQRVGRNASGNILVNEAGPALSTIEPTDTSDLIIFDPELARPARPPPRSKF